MYLNLNINYLTTINLFSMIIDYLFLIIQNFKLKNLNFWKFLINKSLQNFHLFSNFNLQHINFDFVLTNLN
jgi:hypothetical protein